jgi:hypothetical protein
LSSSAGCNRSAVIVKGVVKMVTGYMDLAYAIVDKAVGGDGTWRLFVTLSLLLFYYCCYYYCCYLLLLLSPVVK